MNFCRTFISSISLFVELAGSNLAQTLLNPSKVIWHLLFLLNVSVVFVNAEKRSVQNTNHFHKTITYLTRFDNVMRNDFVKTVYFSPFSSFNGIQI